MLCLRFFKLLSVACCPSRREAASPGRNSVAVKMATDTKKRVTTIRDILMIRNLKISEGSLAMYYKGQVAEAIMTRATCNKAQCLRV